MYSLKRTFFLLALFAVALGQDNKPTNTNKNATKGGLEINLNEVFDDALPSIRDFMVKYMNDRVILPDAILPFETWHISCDIEMFNGHLYNISTIYRKGDIFLQNSFTKLFLHVNIGFETLDINYDCKINEWAGLVGLCGGLLSNVSVSCIVKFDLINFDMDIEFFPVTADEATNERYDPTTDTTSPSLQENLLHSMNNEAAKKIKETMKNFNKLATYIKEGFRLMKMTLRPST